CAAAKSSRNCSPEIVFTWRQPEVRASECIAVPSFPAGCFLLPHLPRPAPQRGFLMANRTRCFGALVALIVSVANLQAASPNLGSIAPMGIQRGVETVVNFQGARLSDAKEILFYSPGLTVTKLQIVNDGQVKATVKAAPDCRLGEHVARVRTA